MSLPSETPTVGGVVLRDDKETRIVLANESDAMGVVTFPPGALSFLDGSSTRFVDVAMMPGTDDVLSSILYISTPTSPNGQLLAGSQVQVCLAPRANASIRTGALCLAVRTNSSMAWSCEEDKLVSVARESSVVVYCGYAHHVAAHFALVHRDDADAGRALPVATSPSVQALSLWFLFLVPVAVCCVVAAFLAVRRRRKRSEKREAEQWRMTAVVNESDAAAADADDFEDVQLARILRRRRMGEDDPVGLPLPPPPQPATMAVFPLPPLTPGGSWPASSLPPPPPSFGLRRSGGLSSDRVLGTERRASFLDSAVMRAAALDEQSNAGGLLAQQAQLPRGRSRRPSSSAVPGIAKR